jgi:hypothetical protein
MFAHPYSMCVINYYKLGPKWFLDLPEYLETKGTSPEDLERIGSFHDFLQWCSQDKDEVFFDLRFDFFEGADILQLTGNSGGRTGAYYHIDGLNGKELNMELWFNSVTYHFCESFPERIYIKQIL